MSEKDREEEVIDFNKIHFNTTGVDHPTSTEVLHLSESEWDNQIAYADYSSLEIEAQTALEFVHPEEIEILAHQVDPDYIEIIDEKVTGPENHLSVDDDPVTDIDDMAHDGPPHEWDV